MVGKIRKNYLLPADMVMELEKLVKSGRYANETEVIRRSLQILIEEETEKAKKITDELDNLAKETAKFLPKGKTAGELVHEAHVEESHLR